MDDNLISLSCNEAGGDVVVFRKALHQVGDKWSVLIVYALRRGPVRFKELQRTIAMISERMLSLRLRQLERYGFLTRAEYQEIPPRVEYALTALGKELCRCVIPLAQWVAENTPAIKANLGAFEEERTAHQPLSARANPVVSESTAGRR